MDALLLLLDLLDQLLKVSLLGDINVSDAGRVISSDSSFHLAELRTYGMISPWSGSCSLLAVSSFSVSLSLVSIGTCQVCRDYSLLPTM
jgi:hypothetical protein